MRIIFCLFLTFNLYSKDIIGSIDKLDFPAFNLENVETRIDTGATNSSLHCTNIEKINDKFVKCNVLGKENFIKEISKIKEVKSSNGISQNRFFIKTEIIILGKTYISELSLNDRSSMSYPFLLGRDILAQDFIVDVSKDNISFNLKESIKN
ncbi:ATP-dependent zinc protease [Arcobacter sp. s6]|uniref:ATP-dependent zinc protease n=1 Tax=Arcobacter sp. s6 TaxID=3230363 RepID=UPI0034A01B50